LKKPAPGEPLRSLEIYVYLLAQKREIEPEKAVHIFRLIYEKSPSGGLSDEDLEHLTGYKQGEIRRILRLLHEARITVYKRGKHPKTEATRYYWRIDPENINVTLLNLKKRVLQKLRERLDVESTTTFYACPADGAKYTLEEAYLNDFTCPRCGMYLEQVDSTPRIEALQAAIRRLEEEIRRDEKRIFRG